MSLRWVPLVTPSRGHGGSDIMMPLAEAVSNDRIGPGRVPTARSALQNRLAAYRQSRRSEDHSTGIRILQ